MRKLVKTWHKTTRINSWYHKRTSSAKQKQNLLKQDGDTVWQATEYRALICTHRHHWELDPKSRQTHEKPGWWQGNLHLIGQARTSTRMRSPWLICLPSECACDTQLITLTVLQKAKLIHLEPTPHSHEMNTRRCNPARLRERKTNKEHISPTLYTQQNQTHPNPTRNYLTIRESTQPTTQPTTHYCPTQPNLYILTRTTQIHKKGSTPQGEPCKFFHLHKRLVTETP